MAGSKTEFLNDVLPEAVHELAEYMNARVSFLVEQSGYFDTDFMLAEGLVERERFLAMFGVAGLADSVNHFFSEDNQHYGKNSSANEFAEEILLTIQESLEKEKAVYSEITNGKFFLHAQAGLSTDEGVTSGVRIKVGDEPDTIYEHLRHSALFHKPFVTGCSDIFPFDSTAERNPGAMLDVMEGAFGLGARYCAFYANDGDMIRITGYLIKKSDMEKYLRGDVVLQDNVINGSSNYKLNNLGERKLRAV